jgi:hypothetical protein
MNIVPKKTNKRSTKVPKKLESNPRGLKQHIKHFEPRLTEEIMTTKNKGVLKRISKYAFATPHGVKANCYAFFLTLPDIQWQDRKNKTQPGDKCKAPWSKTPLNFSSRGQASNQLIRRVMCDNGANGVVNFIKPLSVGYPEYITQIKLPEGYVLGCCIVGGSDYHFCRREGIDEILNNKAFKEIWATKNIHNVRKQLKELQEMGHTYCWSHVAGWSGRLKLVDSDGKVITNPVDKKASGNAAQHLVSDRANHNYNGLHYDTFVAFFIVKARKATVKDDNKIPRNENAANSALKNMGLSNDTVNDLSKTKNRVVKFQKMSVRPRILSVPGMVTSHLKKN